MNIRMLHYFVTIVDEGQITLAAKKLHIAQPPLSQYLKKLEEEIGSQLIIRDGNRMELTDAGEVLYNKGKVLLSLFEETLFEAKETAKGLKGTLKIGVHLTCSYYLPLIIDPFTKEFPDININLMGGDRHQIRELLKEKKIELAIVRTPIENNEYYFKDNYSKLTLGIDPFIYVMPSIWEEAMYRTTISMKEIANFPMLALRRSQGKGVYELVIKEFRRLGIEPKFLCESSSTLIILSLIIKGIGGAIMPKSALPFVLGNKVKILEITDCIVSTDTSLLWSNDRYISKMASHFIETTKSIAESLK